ncbi:MAG: DMT family transporter [Pseudomonadota bacterium]
MIAFAGNSILTRLALAPELIAADRFATLRVLSGVVTLWIIVMIRRHRRGGATPSRPDWRTVLALFVYLFGFSFAYETLDTGTGALILFGAVQLTMLGCGLYRGERLPALGWLGLAVATAGIVVLLAPGTTAPEPWGAVLMLAAGIAWGVYSLVGGGGDPLGATAWNFLLAAPLVIAVDLAATSTGSEPAGIALAVASGSVASGLGYVLWFAAREGLSASRAAAVQLTVPAIAALGGVILLAEPVTARLLLASAATLGGVAVVLAARARKD